MLLPPHLMPFALRHCYFILIDAPLLSAFAAAIIYAIFDTLRITLIYDAA